MFLNVCCILSRNFFIISAVSDRPLSGLMYEYRDFVSINKMKYRIRSDFSNILGIRSMFSGPIVSSLIASRFSYLYCLLRCKAYYIFPSKQLLHLVSSFIVETDSSSRILNFGFRASLVNTSGDAWFSMRYHSYFATFFWFGGCRSGILNACQGSVHFTGTAILLTRLCAALFPAFSPWFGAVFSLVQLRFL